MKQLTCEMCGSTDLIKQDGFFVCQTCGCKYSVEEAKKMMVEVAGAVEVKNAAQLESLLNLANSSFESKNYAQAEEFCNQVIAMDDKNYDAWKLKGEAINYQINAKNQRILEVYNCIMTSYRVLSDEDKETKKYEIISSLKTCFEGEVDFWLKQFEAGRPTDAALTRAKNAYIDSYNKMASAFDELGLEDSKEGYLINFDNFFVGKCNAICNDAWKSTVGYNYYRDYMGKGKDPFGRSDQRWVIADTDLYRPSKHIWETFRDETDNLIALLQFAEEQFNDDTNPKVMEAIYSNIAFFEECVIPSGSWKITQGYTSNWDQYKTVGWHEEYGLTDAAKEARRKIVNKYKEKERTAPKEAEARQRAKKEKERQERIAKYWAEHKEEKSALDAKLASVEAQLKNATQRLNAVEGESGAILTKLQNERNGAVPSDNDKRACEKRISEMESEYKSLGLFKGKEKKALMERINDEKSHLSEIESRIKKEKQELAARIDAQINDVKAKSKPIHQEIADLNKQKDEINAELTKDR